MATKLDRPLKREIQIAGKPYMLTITPEGFKLVPPRAGAKARNSPGTPSSAARPLSRWR